MPLQHLRRKFCDPMCFTDLQQPPLHAPQYHMLTQCENHPKIFYKKIQIDPDISDDVLDQIIHHPIFHSHSPVNSQLPMAVQLGIFLNWAGCYENAISISDIALWAGVGESSVVNCTNHVMVALLDHHNTFIKFPTELDSVDHRNAKAYAGTVTCQQWQGGWLAPDGSAISLFKKPEYYRKTFYDQKLRYSLNYQVCDFF